MIPRYLLGLFGALMIILTSVIGSLKAHDDKPMESVIASISDRESIRWMRYEVTGGSTELYEINHDSVHYAPSQWLVSPDRQHIVIWSEISNAQSPIQNKIHIISTMNPHQQNEVDRGGSLLSNIAWNPDSQSIAYIVYSDETGLHMVQMDLNGNITVLHQFSYSIWSQVSWYVAWRDNTTVAYSEQNRDQASDRYIANTHLVDITNETTRQIDEHASFPYIFDTDMNTRCRYIRLWDDIQQRRAYTAIFERGGIDLNMTDKTPFRVTPDPDLGPRGHIGPIKYNADCDQAVFLAGNYLNPINFYEYKYVYTFDLNTHDTQRVYEFGSPRYAGEFYNNSQLMDDPLSPNQEWVLYSRRVGAGHSSLDIVPITDDGQYRVLINYQPNTRDGPDIRSAVWIIEKPRTIQRSLLTLLGLMCMMGVAGSMKIMR